MWSRRSLRASALAVALSVVLFLRIIAIRAIMVVSSVLAAVDECTPFYEVGR
jgi:hypothetical protein